MKTLYTATVRKVDGTEATVSGAFEDEDSLHIDLDYSIKCHILQTHFDAGEAVGTNSVTLTKQSDPFDDTMQDLVTTYQCPGCNVGSGMACFKGRGLSCRAHIPAASLDGRCLGMPRGFMQISASKTPICIFESVHDFPIDNLSIPVWKHLDEHGNTVVRGLRPHRNQPFLNVYVGDVRSAFDCFEVSTEFWQQLDVD